MLLMSQKLKNWSGQITPMSSFGASIIANDCVKQKYNEGAQIICREAKSYDRQRDDNGVASDGIDSFIVQPFQLNKEQISELYELYANNYDGTNFKRFEDEANKSTFIIIVTQDQRIVGFMRIDLLTVYVDGRKFMYVWLGNICKDPSNYGDKTLILRFVNLLKAMKTQYKSESLLLFSIFQGWQTFLLFNRYFAFYPYVDLKFDGIKTERLLDMVAKNKLGDCYNAETKLAILPNEPKFKEASIAPMNDKIRNIKEIKWFLKHNPNYNQGTENAMIADLSHSNIAKAYGRVIKKRKLMKSKM